jgi:hypothetical protein
MAPAAAAKPRAVARSLAAALCAVLLLALAAPAAAWPAYQKPGPGDSRGPCPALNTLANHGYINRNGRDVSTPALAKALKQVFNFDFATGLAVGGGVAALDRLPGPALLGAVAAGAPAVQTSAGPLAFGELAEMFAAGRSFFSASFARDDSAPFQAPPRPPNATRIDITLAFAQKAGGYLTPAACAAARQVLYSMSKASNPRFAWPPLAPVAHAGDCVLSLAVLGEGDRVRADHLRSFWAEERLPEDWAPRKTAVTLVELLGRLRSQSALINAQPGCAQGC